MLAVGFLGPAPGVRDPGAVVPRGAGSSSATAGAALLINIAGSSTPTLLVAYGFAAIDPPRSGPEFVALLVARHGGDDGAERRRSSPPLMAILDGRSVTREPARPDRAAARRSALNCALVAVIAAIYAKFGPRRARLRRPQRHRVHVHAAARRRRPRAHARVREPVVGRPVEPRPHARGARLARRAPLRRRRRVLARPRRAARDVARASRSSPTPPGLLHDIGKFALLRPRHGARRQADSTPTGAAIRRHPDIGARLLRDIGVYGPVADIVRAHHERVDGRGYPRGLKGEDIPAIARVVAVAEVYDTLTAPDTYRTPMTSFEALTELRRVAGKQLDARLRRGAGRAARRPRRRVPPRRRGRLRPRARHGAAAERGGGAVGLSATSSRPRQRPAAGPRSARPSVGRRTPMSASSAHQTPTIPQRSASAANASGT